jgi:hypothetical protein
MFTMLKQLITIIALSIGVIVAMPYAQQGLQALITVHDWIANVLTQVFTMGEAGNITRNLIALLAVPVLVAFVPVIFYWVLKRSWFPYFMQVVSVIWLVQTSALVILYSAAG